MKSAHLNAPKVPAPDTDNHEALAHFLTGEGHTPYEREGIKLEGVDVVLMRSTVLIPGLKVPGKRAVPKPRMPDYGVYIRLADQWFKAFDIPTNDSSVATVRGKFTTYGPSPETVKALKRKAAAAANLVKAQREYDKITKGE